MSIVEKSTQLLSNVESLVRTYVDTYIVPKLGIHASVRQVLIATGALTTFTYVISKYFIYRLWLHPTNKIPGPPVDWIPFAGNMPEIIREESGAPHKIWTKKYGGIVSYKGAWNSNRILVTDPNLVKQVLTTHSYDYIKPPATSEFLRRILGNGLLVAEGDIHRMQRKMLNPAFSLSALRGMVPLMTVPGVRLRRKWLSQAKESTEPVELIVSKDLSLATLDVIGITAMGSNFESLDKYNTPDENKISRAYLDVFSVDASLVRVLAFFFPLLGKLPTKRALEVKEHRRQLDLETRKLVDQGILRNKSVSNDLTLEQERAKDLLDLMVKSVDEASGYSMTPEDLQNQCLTFLAAGHETTSVALSWCLWLLAKNPEIQDALREEVRPVFQKINTEHSIYQNPLDSHRVRSQQEANIPDYNTIDNLPLLNNVCKETLRLIPPVPLTVRIADKTRPLGQYVIPKGTIVAISPVVSHHSPEIWGDDVMDFRPSRWNEDRAKAVSPYEYMPFLAGVRQCIGNKFAMIEMKTLLALLIMDLKYTEKEGFHPIKKQQVTLRPSPNMTLMVTPA
ncbi:cytochrome P450 [Hesseltinella vesiculosa]|uniref:Cytochrome P450 n=1 Tax=Hesseltinella vesiculosa TaxID=101127 RepID=A0A1X2GIH2_9FUNG|nr:cytochrome P450 [Hesseltinella vesiculosa]